MYSNTINTSNPDGWPGMSPSVAKGTERTGRVKSQNLWTVLLGNKRVGS